ncbi:hypothetical protein B0H63DRAFT_137964 [Podospora didyma]|uniref:Uncharacterized protein n=1 Tax=Podospora didyma TaxID=330526 RepID=A0AAE0NS89_9PEZI|nr:hypothetical protein B0H63DRAFT_137964 [Podospora didyma]
MIARITTYMEHKLGVMAWAEALYTMAYDDLSAKLLGLRNKAESLAASSQFGDQAKPEMKLLLQDIHDIMVDISGVDTDWTQCLIAAPCEIWGDVTIFSKSKFFVATKAGTLESLAPTLDVGNCEMAMKPLFSVSRSSMDAKRLGILGIFPCK